MTMGYLDSCQDDIAALRRALEGLRAQVRTATLVDVPDGKAFLLALQAADAVLGETAPDEPAPVEE